ncbi:hypothetical protein ACFQ0M_47740 [Kitasatospora aburaviensis]
MVQAGDDLEMLAGRGTGNLPRAVGGEQLSEGVAGGQALVQGLRVDRDQAGSLAVRLAWPKDPAPAPEPQARSGCALHGRLGELQEVGRGEGESHGKSCRRRFGARRT